MAETYKTEDGTGSKLIFTYPFPVLKTEDVKVALNGGLQATTKYTVSLSPAQITFNNTSINNTLQESTGAPKSGVEVRIFRNTEVDNPKARFAAGNSVRAADLNNNVDQALYALQEEKDQPLWDVDFEGGTINGVTIGGTTPAAGTFSNLTVSNLDGTTIGGNTAAAGTFTTGTIATADINGGAIDGTIIGANTAAAGTFTTGTITTADINGGNIDGTTIGGTTPAAGDFTRIVVTATPGKIVTNTSDGSDNNILALCAGGDTATDRGGLLLLHGNESSANAGDVQIASGHTSTGKVLIKAGSSSTLGLTIDQDGKAVIPTADINGGNIDGTTIGATTAASGSFTDVTLTSTLPKITTNTSDGSDDKTLLLCGGGSHYANRGAVIGLYGNETSSTPGEVLIFSGQASTSKITLAAGPSSTTGLTVTQDGDVEIPNDLSVSGTLTVSGTTTTLNTSIIEVEDKNITLAKVSTPTDVTADGGGLTIKGATDKTFNWVNATDAFTSSEHIYLNADNRKLKFGAASEDASIYYDGSDLIAETNSVLVKTTSNQEFMVDDVVRFMINDGNDSVQTSWPIVPMQDGEHDLGTSSLEWRDLYIDGTAYLDAVDINDGNIDGTIIGANSAAAGTFTSGTFTSVNLLDDQKIKLGDADDDDAEIYYSGNSLYIDSEKGINLDTGNGAFSVSADGTAKLGWTSVVGGYVNDDWLPFADDTHSLGSTAYKWKNLRLTGTAYLPTVDIDAGNIDGTIIGANSAAAGTFTTGTITTADINGGNIDGTTIGATTAAAGTFTTGSFNDITLTDSAICSITTNSTDGSDDKVLVIGGGGAETALRGGIAAFYGNESGSEGNVAISTGRTANAKITLTAGLDGTADLTVTKDGDVSLANHLTLPDDKKIKLGTDSTDYSEIYFTGNALTIKSDDDILIDADDALDIKSDSNQNFYVGETIRFQLHNTAEQITANWPIIPGADDTYDLGSESTQWQDIYIDGTAYLDSVDIDSGNIDGTTIGATTPVAGTFTTLKTSTTVGQISSNTDDGSDIKNLHLCGGGGTGNARGATISLSGNEATNAGNLYLYSGAVTTGEVFIYAGDSTTLGIKVNQHGNVVIPTDLTVQGTLNVTGTTTTINTTNLEIEDKNITLAKVSTPTDTTADGGGITIKGETDKTFNWVDATDAFTSSEHIHLNGDGRKLILGASSTDSEIYYQDNNFLRLKSAGSISLDTAAGNFLVADDGTVKFGWATAVGFYVDDDVKPLTTDSHDLGHSSLQWKDLYIDGVAYLDEVSLDDNQKIKFGSSADDFDIYFTDASSGQAYIETGSRPINIKSGSHTNIWLGSDPLASFQSARNIFYRNCEPDEDNHLDLGSSDNNWKDLYLSGNIYSSGTIECLNELRSKTGNDLKLNAGSANRDIFLQVNDSTLMTVQGSTGNVGIGTSSPVGRFHVHNAGTGSGDHAYAYFTTGDTGATASDGLTIGVAANQEATINYREAGTLNLNTSGTPRITILSDGKVGINDNNPDNQLVVKAVSGHSTAKVTSGDETTSMVMQAIQGSEGRLGMSSNHPLAIYAGGSERLTIDTSGNASLGGSLTVNTGGTNVTSSFVSTDAYAWIQFKDNGTTDTAVMVGAQDDKLLLRSGSNTAVTIDENQNATFEGTIAFGGAGSYVGSNVFRFSPSGAAYIDHETVGQSVNFRTSASSALDTTALTIASDGDATFAGEVTAKRLTLSDDGATSPIFMLKTDDSSPWGFTIKNDNYSTSAGVGLKAYQANDGDFYLRLQGHGEYNNFYLRQHNGTTNRDLVKFDASGDATFTGDVKLTGSTINNITNATADGSDDQVLIVGGGGSGFASRGAIAAFYGNEVTSAPGDLLLYGGGTSTSKIKLHTGSSGTLGLTVDENQNVNITGELRANGNVKITNAGPKISLVDSNNDDDFEIKNNDGVFTIRDATDDADRFKIASDGSITFGGSLNVTAGQCKLNDSYSYVAGTDNDFQIYFDGTHSKLVHTPNTGNAYLASDSLILSTTDMSEYYLTGTATNGAVDLYYDGSPKFSTKSYGVFIDGHLQMDDNDIIKLGNSNDLQIFHDGSNSYIDDGGAGRIFIESNSGVTLQTSNGSETTAQFNNGGAVKLYYDGGNAKFETTSTGVKVTGRIDILGTGTRIDIADSGKIILGDDNDLQLYFDGTNSIIDSNTGELLIRNLSGSGAIYLDAKTGERGIKVIADGAVELYYDGGNPKFETTSTGVQVTGTLSANTTSSTSTQNAANGTAYTAAIVADGSTGGSGTGKQGAIAINNCGTTSAWGIIAKPASGVSISVLGAWFDEGGDTCGSIYIGDSGTSYNTSSDYRIKENAVDISDGITRLKQLKPYKFNFKKVPSKTVDGFFAHEAQTVVPEAVTGTKDEVDSDGKAVIQGIDQSKLVPLLTAALQEAIAKIEVLETKVAALEAG